MLWDLRIHQVRHDCLGQGVRVKFSCFLWVFFLRFYSFFHFVDKFLYVYFLYLGLFGFTVFCLFYCFFALFMHMFFFVREISFFVKIGDLALYVSLSNFFILNSWVEDHAMSGLDFFIDPGHFLRLWKALILAVFWWLFLIYFWC